ncbi:MAG: hypothetical protein KDA75_05800 [Planctomycetaceae bacterium]|nr:hypothetical protein [Planctomycetaceae bacterium]
MLNRRLCAIQRCLLTASFLLVTAHEVAHSNEIRKPGGGVAADRAVAPFDLSGRWVMTLPAGWQRKVTISWASDETWLFKGEPGVLLNGVYQLDPSGERFWLIEADDPSQIAYEWQVLNANTLLLTRQDTPSGGSYVGATLARDFRWNRLEDNSRVEPVGTNSHRTRVAGRNELQRPSTELEQELEIRSE